EELLGLDGRVAWHFPQNERGIYAGYHPASGADAVEQLEALRAKGAEFVLFPSTAFWWLDHYGELREHLGSRYRLVARQEGVCAIFDLREQATPAEPAVNYGPLVERIRGTVEGALPSGATVLVVSRGDEELLALNGCR